jgi:hypothetical protein
LRFTFDQASQDLPLSSLAPQRSSSKSRKTLSTAVIFNQDQLEAHCQGSTHQDSELNVGSALQPQLQCHSTQDLPSNYPRKLNIFNRAAPAWTRYSRDMVSNPVLPCLRLGISRNVTHICGFKVTPGSVLDELCNHRCKASCMVRIFVCTEALP